MPDTLISEKRFHEILNEELNELKKHLTKAQIAYLYGPSESTKIALNNIEAEHIGALQEGYKWPWEPGVSWDPRDSWLSDKVVEPVADAVVDAAVATADVVAVTPYEYWKAKGAGGGIEEFYEEAVEKAEEWGLLDIRDWIANSGVLRFVEGVLALGGMIALGVGGTAAAPWLLGGAGVIAVGRGIAQMTAATNQEDFIDGLLELSTGLILGGLGRFKTVFSGGVDTLKALATLDGAALAAFMARMKKLAVPAVVGSQFTKFMKGFKNLVFAVLEQLGYMYVIVDQWEKGTMPPAKWKFEAQQPEFLRWALNTGPGKLWLDQQEITLDNVYWEDLDGQPSVNYNPTPQEKEDWGVFLDDWRTGKIVMDPRCNLAEGGEFCFAIPNPEEPAAQEVAEHLTNVGAVPAEKVKVKAFTDEEVEDMKDKAEAFMSQFEENLQESFSQMFNSSRLQLLANI